MVWADVFLGVIAVATLATAMNQIAVIVVWPRHAAGDVLSIEQDIKR